jgi:flagellar hook-associated protein 1 FlgK
VSLLGALSLGGSSLAAQQTGLQVTGNNLANAGSAGYTRQTVNLLPAGSQRIGNGQFVGTGVAVDSIERQANEAINESLRQATSSQTGAQTLDTLLGRIQTTFGALDDNDLSARLTSFFNGFSTLAGNPTNEAQRSVVVQSGVSLANYLTSLRSQLTNIRSDAQDQAKALVTQADALVKTIANLNGKISQVEGGGSGMANDLRDQRDQALSTLAGIMDIKVVDQGGGNVNVLIGSMPVVEGTTTRGISGEMKADVETGFTNLQVQFADNGDPIAVTGGKLGALIEARDSYLTPAVQTVDSVAAGLISAVNAIHTQGQGLTGFSSVTGTTRVMDSTAALNAGEDTTGLAFTPKNGSFNLYIKNEQTGEITTKQISVNLSGVGTQTSLSSLASSITTAGGGNVTGTVNANGRLVIASNDSNVTFGFGEDTSGVLATLGINTFFTGTDATDIGVNSVLTKDSSMLATGRGNVTGSNGNAQALALGGSAAVSILNGKSLTEFYGSYIGTLSAQAKNVSDDATAQKAIYDTIYAQQQAISGVSMDEEAINLTKYQRAFQGTARFITVVDELMQTVLGLVG